MNRTLCITACIVLAGLTRAEAVGEADPARIAAEPEAYVGRAVTVAVKFSKIDNGRDPWEEQGDLKTSRVIKFTTSSLGGVKCYANRTPRNMEALTKLKKGKRLILTGAVKKYRPAVKVEYDVTGRGGGGKRDAALKAGRDQMGGRRRGMRDDDRTEYGPNRYVFMVESVARAE